MTRYANKLETKILNLKKLLNTKNKKIHRIVFIAPTKINLISFVTK